MGQKKVQKLSEEEALREAEEQLKAMEVAKEKKPEGKRLEISKDQEVDEKKEPKTEEQENKEKKVDKEESPTKDKKIKIKKPKKEKIRSKKYQEKNKLVDRTKLYTIDKALDLVKKTSYAKFDSSVEVHVRLIAGKKADEGLRGLLQLPHPTGKMPSIGIIDENLVEKILKDKKTEFDILLAKPEMMPKIARVAKILGPQGKMPNPKTQTITSDPQKTISEIKSGRIEYKTDKQGIIHLLLGKTSHDSNKLKENFQAIIAMLPITKLQSITICATMGPGIKVQF